MRRNGSSTVSTVHTFILSTSVAEYSWINSIHVYFLYIFELLLFVDKIFQSVCLTILFTFKITCFICRQKIPVFFLLGIDYYVICLFFSRNWDFFPVRVSSININSPSYLLFFGANWSWCISYCQHANWSENECEFVVEKNPICLLHLIREFIRNCNKNICAWKSNLNYNFSLLFVDEN